MSTYRMPESTRQVLFRNHIVIWSEAHGRCGTWGVSLGRGQIKTLEDGTILENRGGTLVIIHEGTPRTGLYQLSIPAQCHTGWNAVIENDHCSNYTPWGYNGDHICLDCMKKRQQSDPELVPVFAQAIAEKFRQPRHPLDSVCQETAQHLKYALDRLFEPVLEEGEERGDSTYATRENAGRENESCLVLEDDVFVLSTNPIVARMIEAWRGLAHRGQDFPQKIRHIHYPDWYLDGKEDPINVVFWPKEGEQHG